MVGRVAGCVQILGALLLAAPAWARDAPHDARPGSLQLVNQSYPRGGQGHLRAFAGRALAEPVAVVLESAGTPVAGRAIWFRLVEAPEQRRDDDGALHTVETDAHGRAEYRPATDRGAGTYVFHVTVEGDETLATPVQVRIQVLSTTWYIALLIGLVGGLALFLFGMGLAGRNLQKVAGERLRNALAALTRNQYTGAVLGVVITFCLQSSSASTVMLVGLVSATLMTLTQAIGVLIGAKVGTTLTVQLISFNIAQYSLALVALGFGVRVFGKNRYLARMGKVIIGFGLIFFGMGVMSQALAPLRSDPEFVALLLGLGEYPILAVVAAMVFTAVIQSSSATIGVSMAFATHGLLDLTTCLAISIGSSVGTCSTALLAGLGANRAGKQVAVAHLVFAVLAMLVALPFLDELAANTDVLCCWLGETSIARQIATGFTVYTVATALLFLPFAGPIERLTLWLARPEKSPPPFGPKFLQPSSVDFPVVAIEQAYQEALRIGEIVRQQLVDVNALIEHPDERRCYELAEIDDQIDTLERAIRPFLARVGKVDMNERLASQLRAIVYVADALESIGDVIVTSLLHALEKMAARETRFSSEGRLELQLFLGMIVRRYDMLAELVRRREFEEVLGVIEEAESEEWEARRLRASHLQRLHQGFKESVESSEGHMTVIGALLAIDRRITDIARTLYEEMTEGELGSTW